MSLIDKTLSLVIHNLQMTQKMKLNVRSQAMVFLLLKSRIRKILLFCVCWQKVKNEMQFSEDRPANITCLIKDKTKKKLKTICI